MRHYNNKEDLWLYITLTNLSESKGHYVPTSDALQIASKKLSVNFELLQNNNLQFNILKPKSRSVYVPFELTFLGVHKFLTYIKNYKNKRINVVIYDGNFNYFYYFLMVSILSKKIIIVHLNWSNNSQIHSYSESFLSKIHFTIIKYLSAYNFIHYVENPSLQKVLESRTNFKFQLFPTMTVFEDSLGKHKRKKKKIVVFINDKNFKHYDFLRLIDCIDNNFYNHKIIIFNDVKYKKHKSRRNSYKIIKKQTSRKEYFNLIGGAKLCLFFYNEDNYKYLTSGRFLDAIYIKSLIVVPDESKALDWLGSKYGNFYKINLDVKKNSSESIYSVSKRKFQPTGQEVTPENTLRVLSMNSLKVLNENRTRFMIYFSNLLIVFLYAYSRCKFAISKNFYFARKATIRAFKN